MFRFSKIRHITLLTAFLLAAVTSEVKAQTYGNEWINYSQQYYKFPIIQTGVYRIPQSTMIAAIPNLNSIDPRRFQLFFRGQEIPIYIPTEGDGLFDSGDYIEFFAQPNDGWLDSALYVALSSDQPNPGYSLFSDTSYYFLTWNGSTSNLRYANETDVNFAAYTASPYYMYEVLDAFTSAYYEGEIFSGGQLSVEYTRGEGYGQLNTGAFTYSTDWNTGPFTGLNPTMYTAGPQATLRLNLVSANNPVNPTGGNPQGLDHHHQVRVGGILSTDTTMNGHGLYKRFYSTSAGTVAGSGNPFEVDFLTTYSTNTRSGIMYYEMRLPQVFDLNNRTQQYMYLPDAVSQSKSRLDITNFNTSSTTARLYDLTNRRRIPVVNSAGTYQALVPNSGGEKELYLTSDNAIQNITVLQPVSRDQSHFAMFRDFENQYKDFNYLLIYPTIFKDATEVYNAYRNQTGFQSGAIDFEELQDQFGYGIPKHPMAIRNFLRMATNNWNTKPENVFIVGKGIKPTFVRTNTTNYNNSLIPAVGVPPADNLYGFNLDGALNQDVMIGRLAATSEQQVDEYYDKIRDYESNLPAEWMKNVLHLGGGFNQSEQQIIANYLNGYKDIAEDSLLGANVISFFKQSSQPYPITVADSIRDLINETGLSMMTIFGHGSGQGFDQNIEDPENFTNTGKYPLVMVYSCLSGDLFQTTPLISERYVLQQDKGAIGFIASTSLSFSFYLDRFADSIYTNIALRNYGQTIGKSMSDAISQTIQNDPYTSLYRMTGLDMQLHGDPGIRFNSFLKPDLELTEQSISFDPASVTSEIDSFDMQIVVTNLGRAITGAYGVSITRNFPQAGVPDTTYYLTRTGGIYYKDTIRFKLPVDITKSFGENVFTIVADPINQYDELNELNNQVTVKLNIVSSDIIPVYPFNYQVVPRDTITLKAVTGDPFAPLKSYKIEIDTTDIFNSPFKRDTVIQQVGGVLKWRLPFELDVITSDSSVFFWRTGVDSANTGTFYRWKESSFQYIPGKYGWGQDHFFQFKNDEYVYMLDNRTTRTFDFVSNFKELKCTTRPCGTPGDPYNLNTRYLIDGAVQEESGCTGFPAMIVAVIDPITLKPWETNFGGANPQNDFDNYLCRPRVEKYFMFFLQDPIQRAGLENMLYNVPNGHHLLVYTWWQGNFNNATYWPQSLVDAFTACGADTVQTLVDSAWSRPYIFYTRKGVSTSTQQVVGSTNCENIELTATLENDWLFGTITSEVIGPASRWGSFHWNTYSLDANPNNDSARVNIIGITASGQETVLYSNIQPTTTDIFNLDATIDASVYPYLKLFMYTRDDSTTTPSQLAYWHVLYEGVPEIALNPAIGYSFYGDSLSQGEELIFSCAVENIGDYDMDSLWNRFFIIDKNNQTHDFFQKNDSLRVGEFMIDTFRVNTGPYSGLNSIWIETNPLNHPDHQLEQFHFNNIASRTFNVGGDRINPILDVTFDGVHIMDGDIVSAKPEILIQLKDENQYLLLDDTSDFELYLKYPNQTNAVKLNFGQPEITFIPATGPDNVCRIEYLPDFTTEDGIYELLVRATDKNNNISGYGTGDYDYTIKFEVVNKSTITNVMNYPNPFSTQTQFVFTLTGSELPTEFTIQILTISGVVVREITIDELGPIHIGRNITDFRWDGRDEYGDRLATGVYLYRVITKMNDEDIEKSTTNADKYFKNGFGKMYIIR